MIKTKSRKDLIRRLEDVEKSRTFSREEFDAVERRIDNIMGTFKMYNRAYHFIPKGFPPKPYLYR